MLASSDACSESEQDFTCWQQDSFLSRVSVEKSPLERTDPRRQDAGPAAGREETLAFQHRGPRRPASLRRLCVC